VASANLDLVRSIYALWERGDFTSVGWAHPELEYVVADGQAPASWTGVSRWVQDMNDWLGAWDSYRVTMDECREIDGERVLAFHSRRGRGKTSGFDLAATTEKGANVFHCRDGNVKRLVSYSDPERALADLGLAPAG
jgi:ketosteroid isomerase-like protein